MVKRALPLIFSFLLAGCIGQPASAPWPADRGNLGHLDIAGARSLMLAGEMSAPYRTAQISGLKQLYKLDAAGKVVPVNATSPTGTAMPMEALHPQGIFEVNSEFILLATMSGKYLIRRSDGKAAMIGRMGMDAGQRIVDVDERGNIFVNDNGSMVKITTVNIENPDQIVKTTLNKVDIERVTGFAIDRQGNLLASLHRVDSQNSAPSLRLYKAAGGIDLLPFSGFMGFPWSGRDGKLYVSSVGPSETVDHVYFDATGKASSSAVPFLEDQLISGRYHLLDPRQLRAELPDQSVIGGLSREGTFPGGPGSSEPVYVEKAVVHVLKGLERQVMVLAKVEKLHQLVAADTTIYALGQGSGDQSVILKLDPLTKTESIFFHDPQLEILHLSATPDGRLMISAVRSSDGNYLMGEIDRSGALSVITSDLPPVQQMLTLQ